MTVQLETRCFVGEVVEGQEISVTLTEWVYDDDTTETCDEVFELNGELVCWRYLSNRFGEGKMAAFMETAAQHAR